MAKILLIETSGTVCSAAMAEDGRVLALVETFDVGSHAAYLTLHIEACCQQSGIALAQIDAVAMSKGPGAYTSLRVGASVAKGICYGLDKPLIALNTLEALAYGCRAAGVPEDGQVPVWVPMLDARRQELWLALYGADMQEIASAQPLVLENNSFEDFLAHYVKNLSGFRFVLTGSGIEKVRNGGFWQKSDFEGPEKNSATNLVELAEKAYKMAVFEDIAYFEPFYMKPPNITTPGKPPF